ncbi:unnamed protein product, partial [Urochloa humidicola]
VGAPPGVRQQQQEEGHRPPAAVNGGGVAVPAPAAAAAVASVGGGVGEGVLRVPRRAVAEGDGPAGGAERRGLRRPRRALGRLGRRRGPARRQEALLGPAQINGGIKVVTPPLLGPGLYCDEVVDDGGGVYVDPELRLM